MDSVRDRILARKASLRPITVPGWEGLFVPQVSVAQRKELEGTTGGPDGLEKTLVFAVVDADGSRVFTDADKPALGQLPLVEANAVAGEFFDFNGWSENGRASLGKGSGSTTSDTSLSPFAANSDSGTSTTS